MIIEVNHSKSGRPVSMRLGDNVETLDIFGLRRIPDSVMDHLLSMELSLIDNDVLESMSSRTTNAELAIIASTIKEYYPEYTVLVQGKLVEDMYEVDSKSATDDVNSKDCDNKPYIDKDGFEAEAAVEQKTTMIVEEGIQVRAAYLAWSTGIGQPGALEHVRLP